MDKQERSHAIMEATDSVDTKQSKQRASIKWLLSKAYNNRVPENLLEPFYRDHEDQEHLKPPIIGRLASAELYCLALANMYSDPNYHSLNHWNILTTLSRKGIHVSDPADCALTETVLIQTNPLKLSAHMSVIEALMVLYAREVVTLDRVSAAAQRFGTSQPMHVGSNVPHEDGLICWINAACSAFNKAEENTSQHVAPVTSLQEVCDGTALAALVSFYCPDALRRADVRIGRAASLHDCLHNLMLVYEFCRGFLPHQVFHMMPEDVAYMRGSMRQNLIVMLADLFNMLEVHPVKCVKYPGSAGEQSNAHGVRHKRSLPPPPPTPIPDLRPDDVSAQPFQVPRSPSACAVRARVPTGRSACSTPERRSCSPQREEFVVHRGRAVTTLAAVVRRDDDTASVDTTKTPAGRPSNWGDARDTFAGRRSRRSSISDDSQLTVENFGGSQDRLHFAGKNPEKELATLANVRKISAPAGPIDHSNPPVRSSRQDTRGSFQFFHGDYQNGSSQEEKQKVDRQTPQPQAPESPAPFYPIKRQMSSDTIQLNKEMSNAGGDGGFYLNRDAPDGEMGNKMTFADINRLKSNGDNAGIPMYRDIDDSDMRRKSNVSTPNTTTWQQQFLQQPQHNGEGDRLSAEESNAIATGQATAAQLHNVRLKLEEKRRRMELDKRKMELALTRQRQHLGQQAFLQAVTRGKRPARDGDDAATAHATNTEISPDVLDHNITTGRRSPEIDTVALEQYQQSIAKMNTSIQDIQTDIARLANQQNQLTQQQPGAGLPSHQQHYQPAPPTSPYQPTYQPNIPHLHSQFSSQHNVSSPRSNALNNSNFGSTPHIPREFQQQYYHEPQQSYRDPHQNYHDQHPNYHDRHQNYHEPQQKYHEPQQNYHEPQQNYHEPQQNYHEPQQNYHEPQQNYHEQQQNFHEQQGFGNQRQFYLHENSTPQRRTWAQRAQMAQHNDNSELRGWQVHQQQPHSQAYPSPPEPTPHMSWKSPPSSAWQPQTQTFVRPERNGTDNHLSYTVINPSPPAPHASKAPSPQRRANTPQRQGSVPETPRRPDHVSLQQLQTPVHDDMEPQNISFIGNAEDDSIRQGINRLNISSGTRTYRIPSPTRPSLSRNSFQHPEPEDEPVEKGFYISFDNDQPKRPKPPLRAKKGSPKKDRTPSSNPSPERKNSDPWNDNGRLNEPVEEQFVVHRNVPMDHANRSHDVSDRRETPPRDKPNQRVTPAEPAALVIGELNPDPNSAEEMERKKERIMLLSLQRRQRGEEARALAEQAAAARRARHEQVAEQRAARKDMQARRRDAILAQYKLKRAREEAEREGKVLDTTEFMESLKGHAQPAPPTRMRSKPAASRARPKTIHVDSGALHAAEGMLASKQPSSTNLTATGTMRRDYYRGSQDSLADRAGLYADSPVDDRGAMSPSSASGSGPLGRRGSCKTSREGAAEDAPRGRSKYSTYQNNFRAGRKSSSLMNLCDSGLGRATPPRRAASPGARALQSPASGPGSLPGGIGKRRQNQGDDHSDVSSTHSSILDYSGPRLYKQPASKSNRGLMQNAIEHCVFPGAVNAGAARKVLTEMSRSEAKHFLILFRDAACQFRALYAYCPDTEHIGKLYGTGPKNVTERMFDKFFKYNSGSKSFSLVHTKHLTVTIDAFTIHNALWQGKKVQLPSKKDMALVI